MKSKLLFLANCFSGFCLLDAVTNIQSEETLTKKVLKTINETAISSWSGHFEPLSPHSCYKPVFEVFHQENKTLPQPNVEKIVKEIKEDTHTGQSQNDWMHEPKNLENLHTSYCIEKQADSSIQDQRTVEFADGSSYTGQLQNNMKHGHGVLKMPDGTCYEGQWQNNQKHGFGTLKRSNGNSYTGQWQNDSMHGQGTLELVDCFCYTGQFENDLRHGQGTLTSSSGAVYTGQWENDLTNGCGSLRWNKDSYYTGQWQNGSMHGQGTIKDAEGNVYSGEWFKGWPSTHLKDENIIPLDKLATFINSSSSLDSKTTKKGIIFQATADWNDFFKPHKENCHELSKALATGGFDTNYSLFSSKKDLEEQIKALSEKVSLVWLRAHGSGISGNFFDCGKQYGDIQTLSLLEDKLSKDPTIVLQSCNTGESQQLGEQLRDYLCKRHFKPTIIAPDGDLMFNGIDVKKLRLGDVDVKMVDSKGADITRFLTCPERQTPPSIS